jgi:predicted DNA-binding transcriptional regulator AlpA
MEPEGITTTHGTKASQRFTTQPLQAAHIPDALLTLNTAGAIGGLSTSTIYRKAASDPTFPKLVRMGTRCTRIRAGDFMAWLAAQAGAAA